MYDETRIKNYDCWNKKKKYLDKRLLSDSFFFLEREIWWASLGINIGHEINGKNDYFERPILIISKFSHNTFWALPFSTTEKQIKYSYTFTHQKQERILLLSQIRFLSSNRLLRLISRIDESEFYIIKEKIKKFL